MMKSVATTASSPGTSDSHITNLYAPAPNPPSACGNLSAATHSTSAASAGPTIAPAWSIARCIPNPRPSLSRSTDPASIASLGAVRTPLPNLSNTLAAKTWCHPPASAITGLDAADRKYPTVTSGLYRRNRSARYPDSSLKTAAVASAVPSIPPMTTFVAPSDCRNSGVIAYTISDETSMKNDTIPDTMTFRLTPHITGFAASFRSIIRSLPLRLSVPVPSALILLPLPERS